MIIIIIIIILQLILTIDNALSYCLSINRCGRWEWALALLGEARGLLLVLLYVLLLY